MENATPKLSREKEGFQGSKKQTPPATLHLAAQNAVSRACVVARYPSASALRPPPSLRPWHMNMIEGIALASFGSASLTFDDTTSEDRRKARDAAWLLDLCTCSHYGCYRRCAGLQVQYGRRCSDVSSQRCKNR